MVRRFPDDGMRSVVCDLYPEGTPPRPLYFDPRGALSLGCGDET